MIVSNKRWAIIHEQSLKSVEATYAYRSSAPDVCSSIYVITIDLVSIDDLGVACAGFLGLSKETWGQTASWSATRITPYRTSCLHRAVSCLRRVSYMRKMKGSEFRCFSSQYLVASVPSPPEQYDSRIPLLAWGMVKIIDFSHPVWQNTICGNQVTRIHGSRITYSEWPVL